MGRKPTWPPKVQHHKSGRDRVRIRGQDIYLGPTDSDEAKAAYARLLAQMTGPDSPIPAVGNVASTKTVADVVAEWWIGPGQDYSQRGRELKQYQSTFRPLLRLHGPTYADEFGLDQLEEVQRAMASGSWLTEEERKELTDRGKEVNWCRNVVNRRIVRIRTVWRWAEQKKLVPAGAWSALRTLRGLTTNNPRVRNTAKRKAPSAEQVEALAKACPPFVQVMIRLQILSGMRPGEVRVMRPCDIDRGDPALWIFRPYQHKNEWRNYEKLVPLGPACQELLAPLLEHTPPEAWLFPARRGRGILQEGEYGRQGDKPYSDSGYSHAVARAAVKAGLPGLHGYLMRHHAKQRITRDHGLDVARAVLGQKSISTTDGYGDSLDMDLARKGVS